MKYKDGYKYQIVEPFEVQTGFEVEKAIRTKYITLNKHGKLKILSGYAWDGPSGPTVDTKSFMRGSCVHDSLYQLMREERLDIAYREPSDRLLQELCIEDGMWRIRAWWGYKGLQIANGSAALPENKKETLEAP